MLSDKKWNNKNMYFWVIICTFSAQNDTWIIGFPLMIKKDKGHLIRVHMFKNWTKSLQTHLLNAVLSFNYM